METANFPIHAKASQSCIHDANPAAQSYLFTQALAGAELVLLIVIEVVLWIA